MPSSHGRANCGRAQEGKCSVDEKTHVLSIAFGEALQGGTSAVLTIEFEGEINDKMAGFYRSQYTDKESGAPTHMYATQFEATDARKAFPCWDEPAVKAVFEITLVVPGTLTALSNMNEAGREARDGGLVAVRFAPSPIMSTYLVAWVIGELDFVEATNRDGVQVRVYAAKGHAEQGRFGLDVGCRTLAFFNDYFGIAYPLPKMDMVAIPDFSAGAMENWGLVTYRTACLLFDEAHSSLKSKQRILYVVCHELAHQWFGNLVTMDWWSDLWLNEGFATWVGWLAADQLFPEWDIWTEFVVDDCQAGLNLDCLRSSHPIEVPVKNPDEIGQIFDSISYSKGASLIRQLVTFLGGENFKTGLRAYLKQHKYQNARTQDLWASLGEASGLPVSKIMATWTQIIGFPVVTVSTEKRDGVLQVKLRQNRFLLAGDVTPEEDQTLWSIPLRIGTDQALEPSVRAADDLLSAREQTIELPGDVAFFKLNMTQAGFYRVAYPTEWLNALGAAVAAGKIPTADRIGIVSDAFALSVSGTLPVTCFLDLLKAFEGETEYLVWSEISSRLSELLSVWWEQPADIKDKLSTFAVRLYTAQAEQLGFEFADTESDMTRLLRPLILGMAAKCGHAGVIAEAQRRFKDFCAGKTAAIHPNLRGMIYSTVIRHGGRAEFEAVLDFYKKLTVPDQKLAALGALAMVPTDELIQEVLELSLKTEVVRPQDIIYVFRTAAVNPLARRACWGFLRAHFDVLIQRYALGGGISILGRIVSTSSELLTTEEDGAEVEAFFGQKALPSIDQSVKQSVEKIRSNAKWLKRNREPVVGWLAANV